jgi:hypothetical protein
MMAPIVTTKGTVDIGPVIPTDGKKAFMKKPMNIRVDMLNPTAYNIDSIFPIRCNLRMRRRMVPGTKER